MNSHSKRQAGRTGPWLQALMALILGAMLLAAGPARAATETITYIHGDISGSPLAATSSTGAVVWKESYRAYGERWVNDPASAQQSQWFHGKEQDTATGLQYFGARYYDPAVGRFLGIDPVDYQDGNLHSFNRYAYGNNNPVSYLDPDGKHPALVVGAIVFTRMAAWLGARQMTALAVAETGAMIATGAAGPGIAGVEAVVTKAASNAVAKEISLSRAIHGEAAQHAADAIAAGKPTVLTIDRAGAAANRQASIGPLEKVPGKHLDEYPPAMFKEGGAGASVRAINPRDNMSAGACIGNACRNLPDNTRIQINVKD